MRHPIPYFLVFLFLLVSCDSQYKYIYQMTNQSDTPLKASFDLGVHEFPERSADGSRDTVVYVGVNETKRLRLTFHGVEARHGPYFADVAKDFYKFSVKNSDSIESNRDYLLNDAWEFVNGLYKTSVTNQEFQE